jgi:N6-L-threonylcarbamoyladenine synthase
MKKPIFILAIESSCDDTSAAVLANDIVMSNITAGQEVHRNFGGVVPELASRAHQQHIVPVVDQAIKVANVRLDNLDAIAYTKGPGLLGSLLVGSSFAKSLSLALQVPLIEVNHMQAHILAHFIKDGSPAPEFPFLCLTVSGGHTQLVLLKSHFEMELIGQTIDDAAGEAFDKCAKILGLPYPGGPEIDRLAQSGDPDKFQFSKPRIEGLDFSFSGLKTSFLYFLQKEMKANPLFVQQNMADLCASIQKAIVDILIDKMNKAIAQTKVENIALAGGVSANSALRLAFEALGKDRNCRVFIPKFEYCTDNAAMIGIVAYFKFVQSDFGSIHSVATARMLLNEK